MSALLVGVVSTGCGGGDGSGEGAQPEANAEGSTDAVATTVTTSSRSKAEFVQLANRICDRDDAKRATEIGEYLENQQDDGPTGAAAIVVAFRAVVDSKIPARIEQLRTLGAPEGDEQQIEAFLVSLQGILDAPESLTGTRKALRRSADLAHSYGLHECAYLL